MRHGLLFEKLLLNEQGDICLREIIFLSPFQKRLKPPGVSSRFDATVVCAEQWRISHGPWKRINVSK